MLGDTMAGAEENKKKAEPKPRLDFRFRLSSD
jgi:hypothetical protein